MWIDKWFRVAVCCVLAVAVGPALAGSEAAAPAQGAAPTAAAAPDGGPRIVFDTLTHDFGELPAGDDLKTSFHFKNAGDGVLVIEKVKGG